MTSNPSNSTKQIAGKADPNMDIGHWTRPLKNAGIVGMGKGSQGLISLIALGLAARQLGPEVFGFFVLIHGMMFGLSQILRFQSWQAILKFGAQDLAHSPLTQDHKNQFTSLIRKTFTLDIYAAVFGCAIMIIAAGPISRIFELPESQIWIAQIYSLSIAFILLTPTQLGILRLFNRFDLVAYQTAIGPFFRFLGTLYLFFMIPDAGLLAYLSIWFIGGLVARQSMFWMAAYVLKQNGFMPRKCFKPLVILPYISNKPDHRAHHPGLFKFIFGHNIFRSINASYEHIGLLVVGAMLGPAAAGIFKIAQKFSAILIKPTEKLLIPAIYPEFAKMRAADKPSGQSSNQSSGPTKQKKKGRKLIRNNLCIAAGLALIIFVILVMAGKWLITLFSGAQYLEAYLPMIWLSLAGLIIIITHPLEPLLSAQGRVKELVAAYSFGLAIYCAALYAGTQAWGLNGAAIAMIFSASASAICMAFSLIAKRYKTKTYT